MNEEQLKMLADAVREIGGMVTNPRFRIVDYSCNMEYGAKKLFVDNLSRTLKPFNWERKVYLMIQFEEVNASG